jgi:EAL domain-containing protein (putative c-di-GMP-specific phosphodiesterase class I)/GGDEF domain-containing protein
MWAHAFGADVSGVHGRLAPGVQLPLLAWTAQASAPPADPASPPGPEADWRAKRDHVRALGFSPGGAWVRTRLVNPGAQAREIWVVAADGFIDKVDCFMVSGPMGQPERRTQLIVRSGDARPFHARPLDFPSVVLPVSVPAQGEAEVSCLMRNRGAITAVFAAWAPEAYTEHERHEAMVRAMGYGAIGFTMLLALVMALVNRHPMSIMLVAEMLPVLGAISGIVGDGFQVFWPAHPGLNLQPFAWVILGLCTTSLVLRGILQLNRGERWLTQVTIGVSLSLLVATMAWPAQAAVLAAIIQALAVVFSTFLLGICARHWRDSPVAKLVGLGIAVQYVAVLVNGLGWLGLVSGSFQLASLYASVFKALALAAALFYRVRLDRQERAQALAEHTKELEQRLGYEARLRHAATHHARYGLPNQSILEEAIKAALPGERAGLAICVLKLNRFGFLESILAPETLTRLVKRFSGELEAWFADKRHARLLHIEGKQGLAALDDSTLAFVIKGEPETWLLDELEDLLTRRFEWEGLFVAWDPHLGISRVFEEQAQHINLAVDEARITLQWCNAHSRILRFDADRMKREQLAYSLTLDLEGAIERGELQLHYQPKVDLRTGATDSLEALVRWHHPERGLIPPGAFIAEAEATGAINRLTSWAIGEAARFVRGLGRDDVRVSVNITAFDLATPRFVDRVLEILQQAVCSPSQLVLEVTESAALSDRERALKTLSDLRQAGVRIALDDFGTGYSSLAILQGMPLDELKIDRSFVTDVTGQGRKQAVLRAMIDVGHSLGLQVTLEGVEHAETLQWLRAHGGDVVQGHVYSPPLSAEAARAWMQRGPVPLNPPAAPSLPWPAPPGPGG